LLRKREKMKTFKKKKLIKERVHDKENFTFGDRYSKSNICGSTP